MNNLTNKTGLIAASNRQIQQLTVKPSRATVGDRYNNNKEMKVNESNAAIFAAGIGMNSTKISLGMDGEVISTYSLLTTNHEHLKIQFAFFP